MSCEMDVKSMLKIIILDNKNIIMFYIFTSATKKIILDAYFNFFFKKNSFKKHMKFNICVGNNNLNWFVHSLIFMIDG